MKTLTLDATLFSENSETPIKYKKLIADIENLLIYGITDKAIKIENFDFKQGPGPNYVEITLENEDELRVYLQYINTKRIMARELYTIIEDYMK